MDNFSIAVGVLDSEVAIWLWS